MTIFLITTILQMFKYGGEAYIYMVSLEKELKYLLDMTEYNKFIKYLNDNKVKCDLNIMQVNYYIDTQEMDFLKNGITARIRRIIGSNGKYELTFKVPFCKEEKNNIKIKNEFNFELEKQSAENILKYNNFLLCKEKITDILNKFNVQANIEDLLIIGNLITERYFYSISNKLKPINIDISSYFDKRDYEIEWELEEIYEAQTIIEDIFKSLQISTSKKVLSKNNRFYNEYFERKIYGLETDFIE